MSTPTKTLTSAGLPSEFANKEYGMFSIVVQNADIIRSELKAGKQFPFKKLTPLHIGNPQGVGQPPLPFNRQVLACVLDQGLLENQIIPECVKHRAREYIQAISKHDACNESQGIAFVRQNIANYIEKRDGGIKSNYNNIFLTNGAAEGVVIIMNLLINSRTDAAIIPVPRYPIYPALVELNEGSSIFYYLDESKNWELSIEELKNKYDDAVKKGVQCKVLVVINPGNPTGTIISDTNIQEIITFCYNRNILILADEVYQENIYTSQKQFHSFKKILMNMGPPFSNNQELISFHSISKGIQGECGLRGGYMELVNIDEQVLQTIRDIQDLSISPNVIGQLAIDLMVNQPTTVEAAKQFEQQKTQTLNSLKHRAQIVTTYLHQCHNLSANEIEGAMYAFPSIKFSQKALEAANNAGMIPDAYYCNCCLYETGIILVPGSSFGQREGSYHFRITILVYDHVELEEIMKQFVRFNNQFHERFQ